MTRGRALAELKRFLATEDGVGVPVYYETVEASNVYKEILQQASVTAADLVVMGTHGRSGFDYPVTGSVAEKTLRTSPAPVLIVPPLNPEGLPADRGPVRSVLWLSILAGRRTGGGIWGFHRSPLGRPAHAAARGGADIARQRPEGRHRSRRGGIRAPPGGIRPGTTAEVRTRGRGARMRGQGDRLAWQAYQEILRVATERQADLIVLGVHGRYALDRLAFGSTAEHLVRRSTCPVLAVPPPAS